MLGGFAPALNFSRVRSLGNWYQNAPHILLSAVHFVEQKKAKLVLCFETEKIAKILHSPCHLEIVNFASYLKFNANKFHRFDNHFSSAKKFVYLLQLFHYFNNNLGNKHQFKCTNFTTSITILDKRRGRRKNE